MNYWKTAVRTQVHDQGLDGPRNQQLVGTEPGFWVDQIGPADAYTLTAVKATFLEPETNPKTARFVMGSTVLRIVGCVDQLWTVSRCAPVCLKLRTVAKTKVETTNL